MVKQGVVPDELTKPHFDAANQDRLEIQNCSACNRLQNPPMPTCSQCKSADDLEWKVVSGKGKIYNYGVVYDCPVRLLQEDQPFNLVVITLDEDPGIQMAITISLACVFSLTYKTRSQSLPPLVVR